MPLKQIFSAASQASENKSTVSHLIPRDALTVCLFCPGGILFPDGYFNSKILWKPP